jgi:hypothetical protein
VGSAQGAGDVGPPLAGDRPPPRPPAGERGHVRPDDRGVVRLAGDARAAAVRGEDARRDGEVLLLRGVAGSRQHRGRSGRHPRTRHGRTLDHDRVRPPQRRPGPSAARSVDGCRPR